MAQGTEAPERHEKQTAPREHMESHVSNHVNDIRRTEGTSALKPDHAKQSEDLQKKGVLPDFRLVGDAQKTLGDSKATAADKLSSVENLAKHGINKIQVADADGKTRDYSIETNKTQGGKDMVHLYGKDDNGQNKIALRGIDNGNGTFSSEKDAKGNEVGFQGSKWGDTGTGRSNVGNVSDFQGTAAKAPDGQPAKPGQQVEGQPVKPGQPVEAAPRGATDNPEGLKPRGIALPDGAQKPEAGAPAGETKKPEVAAPSTDPKKSDATAPAADPKKPDLTAPPKDAKNPNPETHPAGQPYHMNRADFAPELNKPGMRDKFAARIDSEVGSQGPEARAAFAEEIFNRAASRESNKDGTIKGDALQKTLDDPNYYPGKSRPADSPQDIARAKDAIDVAFKGSDITHGATGNGASFGRGFQRNPQTGKPEPIGLTKKINEENFGVEYNDQNKAHDWMTRYAGRKVYDDQSELVAKK